MEYPIDRAARLPASTHDAGLELLRTELETGHVVLDAIEVSLDQDARARRLRVAWDAHDVVSRHLDANDLHLTTAEADTMRAGLRKLHLRLDAT
jgi:hypothetical protein